MPAEGFATLSSLKDEHIVVVCLDSEMLHRQDYGGRTSMCEDIDLITPLRRALSPPSPLCYRGHKLLLVWVCITLSLQV